jgi:hypothetical protein
MSIFELTRPVSVTPHGNLKRARSKMSCCVLLNTPRPRGVFVKTVFTVFVDLIQGWQNGRADRVTYMSKECCNL